MKLTRKTKEAFLKWLDTDRRMELHLPDVYLNALIIEFFDSTKYKIEIYLNWNQDLFGFRIKHYCSNCYTSRTEATNEAIVKANDLFNSK